MTFVTRVTKKIGKDEAVTAELLHLHTFVSSHKKRPTAASQQR